MLHLLSHATYCVAGINCRAKLCEACHSEITQLFTRVKNNFLKLRAKLTFAGSGKLWKSLSNYNALRSPPLRFT